MTVLFDWALAGYEARGAKISNHVWSSLLEFKRDINDAGRVEREVIEGYRQGLADAGWQADSRQVRCAYLINSLLLFGLTPEAVLHAQRGPARGLGAALRLAAGAHGHAGR